MLNFKLFKVSAPLTLISLFYHIYVGLPRMVYKPSKASFVGSINKIIGIKRNYIRVSKTCIKVQTEGYQYMCIYASRKVHFIFRNVYYENIW